MTEATAQRLRNALGWLGFPLAGMLCGLTFGILEGKDDTWIAMVYGAGVGGVGTGGVGGGVGAAGVAVPAVHVPQPCIDGHADFR